MAINKKEIGLLVVLILFFGFLGYQNFFVNKADNATAQIDQMVSQLQATPEAAKTSEYYGALRAKIALEEYNRNVVEKTQGCNCGERIDLYTQNNPGQWCAMFATWVTKEAGSPLVLDASGSWRMTNSRALAEHLQATGTFYTADDIVKKKISPQIGDFVIFKRGSEEGILGHTDVIVAVGDGVGVATLVGGNVDNRVELRTDFHYLDYAGFLGFGRPEKS